VKPLLLLAVLAGLVVVPLVVIAVFALIGRIFSAPRRFGSILFIVLFVVALGAAAFGYFRAGTVSTAAVTDASEQILVDDSLRAHHEYTVTVQIPDLGSRRIDVPARVHDSRAISDPVQVRAGTLLGVQLARAETERIDELVPLGSLACAIGVVLLTALAASARTARTPVILLVLALLAGTIVQPAIQAVLPRGAIGTASAIATGSHQAGLTRPPSVPALGYLRGPVSLDGRWMWLNDSSLQFVAVSFTPAGRTVPVTAVDVVPAGRAPATGQPVQVRYETSDPRRITLPGSASAQCAWIMLGVVGAIEFLLLVAGLLLWRWRRRSARRRAARERSLARDPSLAPASPPGVIYEPGFATGRDGEPGPDRPSWPSPSPSPSRDLTPPT
jgi:hypothetical protein